MLQWDQQWLLKEQQPQLWVLMQWEQQWEWKAWAKAKWVKPWVVLCKRECLEHWVELWQVQWLEVQLVQETWVRWATWVVPWADLKVEPWAVPWETWVVPWATWVVT